MQKKIYGKSKHYDKPTKCGVSPYNVWRALSPGKNEVLHEKVITYHGDFQKICIKNKESMNIIQRAKKNLWQIKILC